MAARKLKLAICNHCQVRFATPDWVPFCPLCTDDANTGDTCRKCDAELVYDTGCRAGEELGLEEWRLEALERISRRANTIREMQQGRQQDMFENKGPAVDWSGLDEATRTRCHFETELAMKDALTGHLDAMLEFFGSSGEIAPSDVTPLQRAWCDYHMDEEGEITHLTYAPAGDWAHWRINRNVCHRCSEWPDTHCTHDLAG